MPLPSIDLDQRSFQDLVNETKSRISRYCPTWTNHNVSDPGITLIELFAYMVEQMLYQVNRVPEKNYRAFLDMIGVNLAPPNPAQAELTFRLSASQPSPVTIPKGTEVATVRVEGQPAYTFTTNHDLVIVPPGLKYLLKTSDSKNFTDASNFLTERRLDEKRLEVFEANPRPENAFYLGFTQNIARNTLIITLDCENLGQGIIPKNAPLAWEYWDEHRKDWLPLEQIGGDKTGGLTVRNAEVELNLPLTAGARELELTPGSEDVRLAWWLRCRYVTPASNQEGYTKSPSIRRFNAYTVGGTAQATHSQVIRNEELGRSSGEPGQRFKLRNIPILALDPKQSETVIVYSPDDKIAPEVWKQVPDFGESGPNDKHFVCDPVTGEISFGPNIRNFRGEEEQRGAIPPYNTRLVLAAYRTGGGAAGNVGKDTLTVLKTSIPYVSRVTNRDAATGGTNPESLEHALMRGPRMLRARDRAVTAEDFKVLTEQATSGVARALCLTPGAMDRNRPEDEMIPPGKVVIVVVPEVDDNLRAPKWEHLRIKPDMQLAINNYLDERRLLTTEIDLVEPKYQWVTVKARLKTRNSVVNDQVKQEAERRLYRFIRPVRGGPDPSLRFETPGEGWHFGRPLYRSEIYPILQLIDGVEYIEELNIYPVINVDTGLPGPAQEVIEPGPRGLLCSWRHNIVLV